jgi:hypothetical protein
MKIRTTYVYWNLHRRCWSLMRQGRVIDHRQSLSLLNVRFVVRPGERARVLRERQKNIHAFAVGELCKWEPSRLNWEDWPKVTYNPFKAGTFVVAGTNTPVDSARLVKTNHLREVFALEPKYQGAAVIL